MKPRWVMGAKTGPSEGHGRDIGMGRMGVGTVGRDQSIPVMKSINNSGRSADGWVWWEIDRTSFIHREVWWWLQFVGVILSLLCSNSYHDFVNCEQEQFYAKSQRGYAFSPKVSFKYCHAQFV